MDAISCTSVVSIPNSHLPSTTTTLNPSCIVYMVFWFLQPERSRVSGGFNWLTAHRSQSSASIWPQPLNLLSSHQPASVSIYPDVDCLLLCKCPKKCLASLLKEMELSHSLVTKSYSWIYFFSFMIS